MHLRKLELIGFKSFCNKTTLQFEPGITAVVGPNGCGKSNIFDSIRWVLGEQSVKSLRGSMMEDVIFNGTDLKEPLSMAEVNLTFDNRSRFFPVEQDEVVITRRIFKSGESEYLLNKTDVRLKDILELLMGTGIGAESYSLVAQGKIDLILSSKPEERRLVFDEASGITKYKSQKKEALRHLEETEQNLLRVNDIISEVKRQIGSLERQANKARRYKESFEELKTKEGIYALIRKNKLQARKNRVADDYNSAESQEKISAEIIKQQVITVAECQNELKNTRDSIFGLKNEVVNLENSLLRDKQRIEFDRERIEELALDKKQLSDQIELTKTRLLNDEREFNSLKDEYDSIRKNIDDKITALQGKEADLNGVSSEIEQSVNIINSSKADILSTVSKIAGFKNSITDFNSNQQIHLARKRRLELEQAQINEEKSAVETDINDIEREVDNLEREFQGFNVKICEIKNRLDGEKVSCDKIIQEIGNLENRKLSFVSWRSFLEELKTKYEDINESMNAVLYIDKIPQEKISGLVVKITNYLDINDDDKRSQGTVNLKISGEAKSFDLDTRNIIEKIEDVQRQIDGRNEEKTNKQAQIEELEKNLLGLQKDMRDYEITLVNKKTSYHSITERFDKLNDEDNLINSELRDVQRQLDSINAEVSTLGQDLLRLENQQKTKEGLIYQEQSKVGLNNDLKEKLIVVIAQLKAEIGGLEKRIVSDDAALKMLENRCGEDKRDLSNLENRIAESDMKSRALETEIKDLEAVVAGTKMKIDESNLGLSRMQEIYRNDSELLNSAIEKLETEKKEIDGLKKRLYELQMQDKDIEFAYAGIKERLLQAYKIDLDSLADIGALNVSNNIESINEDALSEEINGLKEKVHSYGAVNLVAIEEYDELKKRYDFLTQQQTDLITAKEALHQAILKINRTTKKMFLETFEKVRSEFRNYFKLLFNGGDAQVYLIDENDPLDSGIEIICRPPGKKLQNVLLLSGGEKSMSAIALIFAIFKVKPAPFCVLDEIDAALDEANVDRFGRVLQEFVQTSQFIVITHNKKTIASADIMYGITMEESGVSKIVSVKFARSNVGVDRQDSIIQPVVLG